MTKSKECNKATRIEDIENPKAIEFHKQNLAKFKSAYWNKLADAMKTTSDDKASELQSDAEALRVKYNKRLREYCA